MARVALRESSALVTHDELFADRVKTEKAARQNGVDCFFIALTCFANFAGYSVHALRASAADAIQAAASGASSAVARGARSCGWPSGLIGAAAGCWPNRLTCGAACGGPNALSGGGFLRVTRPNRCTI